MNGALRVARRELRSYLSTPWTYGVSAGFLTLTGVVFYVVADGAREASLRFWFPNLAFVLLVTAPIVTSRLLAEEQRTRHLDVVLARAASPSGVVVGKWLAATALFVLLLVPTLVYVGFLAAWGNPDYPPLVGSYLGAVLLAAMFCAVGTMTSAWTATAVAAGLGSFAILVLAQLSNGVEALDSFSFQPHLDAFSRGAPTLDDLVYFGGVTAACLVLALAWQSRRLGRLQGARALALPALVVGLSVALNWLPMPRGARLDLTSSKRFTLSSASKDVLANVRKPARITVFQPSGTAEARDAGVLLGQYHRQNSRVTGRVLDYAGSLGEALRLGARDEGEVVVEVGERREVVAPLTEQGVTSALQRLARGKTQTVCALAGHGERELDDTSPGGYSEARTIIDANGLETRRLDLTVAQEIPAECAVLLLPGPATSLLDSEVALLNRFLAANGKLMIMRDPDGPDLLPITGPWGLRLLPGVVVDPERGAAGDPLKLLVNRFPSSGPVTAKLSGLGLVAAGGITTVASEDKGLSVAKVAESSEKSWLESDPNSPQAQYQPDAGDRGGPVVLAAAADRSELEQEGETRVPSGGQTIARTRLLVVADADWASNALVDVLDNRRLLVNGLNWLAGQEDLVAVGGEDVDLRRLEITAAQRRALGWVSIGGIPTSMVALGVFRWARRRRR